MSKVWVSFLIPLITLEVRCPDNNSMKSRRTRLEFSYLTPFSSRICLNSSPNLTLFSDLFITTAVSSSFSRAGSISEAAVING